MEFSSNFKVHRIFSPPITEMSLGMQMPSD